MTDKNKSRLSTFASISGKLAAATFDTPILMQIADIDKQIAELQKQKQELEKRLINPR